MESPRVSYTQAKKIPSPSVHHPHPIISRQKANQSPVSNVFFEEETRRSHKSRPSTKPNIENYWNHKK